MQKSNIYNFTKSELQSALFVSLGGEEHTARVRSSVIFRRLYKEKSFSDHCVLSAVFSSPSLALHKSVVGLLKNNFDSELPLRILHAQRSSHDGSVKFICELCADGSKVESVLIPERGRFTLCVSTQVGCAQGCRFCQTGRMGLTRNLTVAEIVSQYLAVEQWYFAHCESQSAVNIQAKISNVVYMGMGEPLDNLENVIKSTHIFCDTEGLNLSPNKVTVSSVGLLPQLDRLLTETKVCFALSLHAPFDEQRSKMMPVNLRYPLHEILQVLRTHAEKKSRSSFFIQYTLLRGVNDSYEYAQELGRILNGLPVKINLIPLNEHEGTGYRRPDLNRVYRFQQELKQLSIVTTIRISKGRDIQAACGQLIKKENMT
ncbi:MAG: 23S rRNA (adenine(2503)-C(2))-methyltransferase RlmN [Silvanigrellaceae bacterium]|nr:23S rRNA (adenine(2503)-C(2))-methyltransferase RlmN [Silvanigrellaceae bacterium]